MALVVIIVEDGDADVGIAVRASPLLPDDDTRDSGAQRLAKIMLSAAQGYIEANTPRIITPSRFQPN